MSVIGETPWKMMTIRVALLESGSKSISGLCGPLQNSGYVVSSMRSASSLTDVAEDHAIDVVVIDGGLRCGREALGCIEACAGLHGVPILVVAHNEENVSDCASWSSQIDDIILLPTSVRHMVARIDGFSRNAKMLIDYRRRRELLCDFGINTMVLDAVPITIDDASALIIEPADERHIEMLAVLDGSTSVSFADVGPEAVRSLDQARPDVILASSAVPACDLQMLIDQLGSTLRWCDIPVVVVDNASPSTVHGSTGHWGQPEKLLSSTHPVIKRCRLQSLIRQSRLRRMLRGTINSANASWVIDPKTELYDHSFFNHYTNAAIADHHRRGESLAIAVIALRGLSAVNETYGFPMGDRILADVATKIARACRAQDLIGRVSGCRIAVLLSDVSHVGAHAFCRRLTSTFEAGLNSLPEALSKAVNIHVGFSDMVGRDAASSIIRRAIQHEAAMAFDHAS